MNIEKLRQICLAMPGVTEQVQWGADLVFKVGGKMFTVAATEPDASHRLAFKCSDETFSELLEVDGITPAPYLARAKWVALERFDALTDREIRRRIAEAYAIVFSKLTRKAQAAIDTRPSPRKPRSRRK